MAEPQLRIVGRASRFARKRLGISRQQMAERIGVSIERLAALENSECDDKGYDVDEKFKAVFGISLYFVVNAYIIDPDKMEPGFAAVLRRLRPQWLADCEEAFGRHCVKID